jgi:hypothetical protein
MFYPRFGAISKDGGVFLKNCRKFRGIDIDDVAQPLLTPEPSAPAP